jgi:transposase
VPHNGGGMSEKRYIVTLSRAERTDLAALIRRGKHKVNARKRVHARVLLKTDQGKHGPGWTDARIAEALEIHVNSVRAIRQRFVEQGLEAALNRKKQSRPSRERKLDGVKEARLIALACSDPPEGRAKWSLRLLADKAVELQIVDAISHETVRRTLKKTR